MNLNNELAKERNRAAAERTMMAWIRTCLSLISFGFGLDKIIAAIHSSRIDANAHAGMSVRLLAMGVGWGWARAGRVVCVQTT